jgi:hypothetical protein
MKNVPETWGLVAGVMLANFDCAGVSLMGRRLRGRAPKE